jgi:hypothetical protein
VPVALLRATDAPCRVLCAVLTQLLERVEAAPTDSITAWEQDNEEELVRRMPDEAFSDVPVMRVYTVRIPIAKMARRLEQFVCSSLPSSAQQLAVGLRANAKGVGGTPSNAAFCTSAGAHAAVFAPEGYMPFQPMLDFLFAPQPTLLSETLLPMLRRQAAWTSTGPRLCVHLRTFRADNEVFDVSMLPSTVYGPCIGCIMRRIAANHPTAQAWLVSDDLRSAALRDFVAPVPLSSPLETESAGPVHINHVLADDRATVARLYSEIIAMSACDMMFYSRSGFSMTGVQWGGLPEANVKYFETRFAHEIVSQMPGHQCPARLFHSDLYMKEW